MADEDVGRELDAAEEEVRRKRLLEELDRDNQVAALRALLGQEPVRDVLWRIFEKCHVFGSVYNRNFGDMSFAEGERNIGLWLLSEVAEADPGALLAMQLKANQIAQAEKLKRREGVQRRRRQS